MPLWGIDLGGTKIEGAILVGPDSPETLCRLRIPTEAHLGYEHLVSRIVMMLDMLEERSGLTTDRVGIGTPGAVDPATGRMKNCNTTCLNGRHLPSELEATLGKKVWAANDANCFALAEARLGAGKGADVVFGVIMGTGVGGGWVVRGQVIAGAQGIAGEWGHNVLEPDGEPCYCGKRGCVETVLSGPGLEKFYAEASGTSKRLPEIVLAAGSGSDPAADATIARLTEKFGEALSVVVNIMDPDVIVLGGGVGNVDALYDRGVDSLCRWVFNTELRTKVVRPSLGDSAGVFGAAMLTIG